MAEQLLLQPEQYDYSNRERAYIANAAESPAKDVILGKESLPEVDAENEQEAFNVIGRRYVMKQALNHRMAAMRSLRGNLRSHDAEPVSKDEPSMTIGMMVGIHDEKEETLDHAFDTLAKQTGIEDGQIVLLSNHPAGIEDQTKRHADMLARYREKHPQLTIRSALVSYKNTEFSMERVRADHTDMIISDAMQRNFSFNHPVIWLDADMKYISPGGLGQLRDAIRDTDVIHSAVTPLQQNFHIEAPEPKDAERLAQVFEIVGRGIIRENFARRGRRPGYNDESGLAFSLGAYMFSGGLSGHKGKNNESHELMHALIGANPAFRQFTKQLHPNSRASGHVLSYLPEVTVSSSGRRVIDTAEQTIRKFESTGEAGTLFQLDSVDGKQVSYGGFEAVEKYRHSAVAKERRLTPEQWRGVLGGVLGLWLDEASEKGYEPSERTIAAYNRIFPEVPYDELLDDHEERVKNEK